ncbi:TRAP transporter large permease [Stappia sp. WLB 29]|uniref:TRAP transporter large permease n=1 Tax=Stappia sp. WLB 29 TaxID=2925220 RepID=UPI0020C144B9|nr:TRAP transporter large permease [Stappia sp. WLB 29]
MTGIEISLLMGGMLIVLLLIGTPISFALGATGVAGLALARSWQSVLFLIGSKPFAFTAELTLIIVPLFLLMGHLAFSAGISRRAFEAARAWVGHIRGGLAMTTILASALFATVSGTSVATAATIGRIAIPEMLRFGYSERLAAGAVAAGGTLGVLIPPSGVLVIYSIATGTRLSDLLLAAILPGIMTAAAYMVGVHLLARFHSGFQSTQVLPREGWTRRGTTLLKAWDLWLLFAVVIGSIYAGVATPTEAAGVGATMALVIALFRLRGNVRQLVSGFIETAVSTAAIFALIIGAGLFSLGLSATQVPQDLAAWVAMQDVSPTVLLILVLLPFLFLGAVVDGLSMILLMMPIVFPIITDAGIDPVLFGILVTKMTEIGVITPPVGLNVFVVKGAYPDIRISEAFKGCIPFVVIELILTGILIFCPGLVLWWL